MIPGNPDGTYYFHAVAVDGVDHVGTSPAHFQINIGDEIIKKNTGNGSPTDGFIEFASKKSWDIITGIQMAARPSGTVDVEVEHFFFFAPRLDPSISTLVHLLKHIHHRHHFVSFFLTTSKQN